MRSPSSAILTGARALDVHATPTLGCRCSQCDVARIYLHRGLTNGQRIAVNTLHFAVPRHQSDLLIRDGVRWGSIASLIYPLGDRPALVRMVQLREANLYAPSMTFLTLTQDGEEIRAAAARHEQRRAA